MPSKKNEVAGLALRLRAADRLQSVLKGQSFAPFNAGDVADARDRALANRLVTAALRYHGPINQLIGQIPLGNTEPKLIAVPYESDLKVPVPYMRWSTDDAVIVLANRDTTRDAHITLRIPIDSLGAATKYAVTDLWRGMTPRSYGAAELSSLQIVVPRDKTVRGGLEVLHIHAVR